MNASSARLLLILLLLLLAPRVAAADPRSTIFPGKGVGSYQLGKKFSAYSNALGKPTRTVQSENSESARMLYFKQYGMYFFVKKDLVHGITVESPLFVTAEGIHVGSEQGEVMRTYGTPQSLRAGEVVYPERGLGFTFQGGKVARIYVMDKEDRDLASGDLRIVPGVRVGGIQLGQATDFVVQQWKKPDKKVPVPKKAGYEMWSYPDKGMIVVVYKNRVDGIMISTPGFRTIKDIHVGSKREDVVRAYGKPKSRDNAHDLESYPDNGIEFSYEKGVVRQILVRDVGK